MFRDLLLVAIIIIIIVIIISASNLSIRRKRNKFHAENSNSSNYENKDIEMIKDMLKLNMEKGASVPRDAYFFGYSPL
jgi:uncharacterized protein YpmB